MHSFHSTLRAFKTAQLSDFSLHRGKQNNCLTRIKYRHQIVFACHLNLWRFYLKKIFFSYGDFRDTNIPMRSEHTLEHTHLISHLCNSARACWSMLQPFDFKPIWTLLLGYMEVNGEKKIMRKWICEAEAD